MVPKQAVFYTLWKRRMTLPLVRSLECSRWESITLLFKLWMLKSEEENIKCPQCTAVFHGPIVTVGSVWSGSFWGNWRICIDSNSMGTCTMHALAIEFALYIIIHHYTFLGSSRPSACRARIRSSFPLREEEKYKSKPSRNQFDTADKYEISNQANTLREI